MEKTKLFGAMLLKGSLGLLSLGLLLFTSAGTLRYPNAWLILLTLTSLMLALGLFLLSKHPETLKKRLNTREREPTQKGYVAWTGLFFVASFVIAGLDFRFGWTPLPKTASLSALGVMVLGYALFCAVMLQNAYASRIIEVQKTNRSFPQDSMLSCAIPCIWPVYFYFFPCPWLWALSWRFALCWPFPTCWCCAFKTRKPFS